MVGMIYSHGIRLLMYAIRSLVFDQLPNFIIMVGLKFQSECIECGWT